MSISKKAGRSNLRKRNKLAGISNSGQFPKFKPERKRRPTRAIPAQQWRVGEPVWILHPLRKAIFKESIGKLPRCTFASSLVTVS